MHRFLLLTCFPSHIKGTHDRAVLWFMVGVHETNSSIPSHALYSTYDGWWFLAFEAAAECTQEFTIESYNRRVPNQQLVFVHGSASATLLAPLLELHLSTVLYLYMYAAIIDRRSGPSGQLEILRAYRENR